jgi:adenylate cyclase
MNQIQSSENSSGCPLSALTMTGRWMAGLLGGDIIPFRNRPRRKLAGILYADVCNYSGLTEEDEEGTHVCLVECLNILTDSIHAGHGKIAHFAGDAVLAEFDDVVSMLKCAVSVQRAIRKSNQPRQRHRRIEFRIGVNLGEVIHDRGDIYGNAVNVAARLESLADSGGIAISDAVRVSVGNRLDVSCVSLGEQWVKNINAPVRAFRLELETNESSADDGSNVVQLRLRTH